MLAPDQTVPEFTLPELDVQALARRAAPAAALAAVAAGAVLLAGGHLHGLTDGLRRGLGVSPGWALLAVGLEGISLAGYVGLLSLVLGRTTRRVGVRESAQITLAGAAATRLFPTAGAGGVALTLWALRRAGLRAKAAARTLLVFLIVLYSVFLLSIVVSGAVLATGLVHGQGPTQLSAIPAVAGALVIAACLAFASLSGAEPASEDAAEPEDGERRSRVGAGVRLLGGAVRDACGLVRSRDRRLLGAVAYWAFDAAVVWAMLHAFGSPPVLPVIALAYFVGQVANTLPIPGSVSAGTAGVLIAFGVSPAVAIPSVLAYRTVAVWLPVPLALGTVPSLRATITRWGREDAGAGAAA
jgi:uncharacterized membrane protein YbhN (UPF0104 family)